MIPTKIIVSKEALDDNGNPFPGAQVFHDRLKVHPDKLEMVLKNFASLFPDTDFEIERENAIKP